jgi:outer membrane lipoprotein carrier protein
MNKILAGVAAVGVAAAIALGVRAQLDRMPAEETPAAETPRAPATPVDPDAPATAIDDEAEENGSGVVEPAPVAARDGSAAPSPVQPPASPAQPPVSAAQPQPAPPPAATSGETAQDAAAILRRASEAYARVETLRADFVQQIENPLLRSRTASSGTIFQRRPDRFLMRFSDPEGDVIVSDGVYFWVYYPSVDARQVIRAPAGEGRAGAVDLQAQFLGDPQRRFAATLHGREEVGGRRAHVLTLVPREAAPYRQLKVWVDANDHLVRRFEITEETGAVRRFELSNLQVNGRLGDDLFRFTPPAGAQVIDRG